MRGNGCLQERKSLQEEELKQYFEKRQATREPTARHTGATTEIAWQLSQSNNEATIVGTGLRWFLEFGHEKRLVKRRKRHDQDLEREEGTPKGGNEKLQFVLECHSAFQQRVRVNSITKRRSASGQSEEGRKMQVVSSEKSQFQGKP